MFAGGTQIAWWLRSSSRVVTCRVSSLVGFVPILTRNHGFQGLLMIHYINTFKRFHEPATPKFAGFSPHHYRLHRLHTHAPQDSIDHLSIADHSSNAINFQPFIPARTELCYENHPENHFKAEIGTVQGKHFCKQDIACTHAMESRNLLRHKVISVLLHRLQCVIEAGIWKGPHDVISLKTLAGSIVYHTLRHLSCPATTRRSACLQLAKALTPATQGPFWERWMHDAHATRKKPQDRAHAKKHRRIQSCSARGAQS